MDPVIAEMEQLRGSVAEIAKSVANLHPSGLSPDLSMLQNGPIDPILISSTIRFEMSFPLLFPDGTQWVIKFPLYTTTGTGMMNRKVLSQVATMKWVKTYTTLPVPTVHGFDNDGTAKWNTLHRPCIIVDQLPGKHISDTDWTEMSSDQRMHIVNQLARITAELTVRPCPGIGSLYFSKGQYNLNTLNSLTINRYCHLYGRLHRDIFKAPKSPYPSSMEFFVDMVNMRLISEAINSTTLTDRFVEMWIYRSLVPSLIFDDFNRGPFYLNHGSLDRTAVLFDEKFDLTGVINWQWSMTEPIQMIARPPPFFIALPVLSSDPKAENEFRNQLWIWFLDALRREEKEVSRRRSRSHDKKMQPLLADFMENSTLLRDVSAVAAPIDVDLSPGFFTHIIEPIFGQLDKESFLKIYRNAPGLLEEFNRIRTFISQREVTST
jgi:hypothetical protein